MFFIDAQTIDYLRLTGRDEAQIRLVETYARHTGLWADALRTAEYERTLAFDLAGVVRNMAGPSNPHARVATSELAARGIAGAWRDEPGRMPDGAVIIAAITSCTNTSNPRNVIAAGLLARNANRLGLRRKPWVKSSLAPGSKAVALYLDEAKLTTELEQLGFSEAAPNPQDEATFRKARLDWSLRGRTHHALLLEWYRALLKVRRDNPVFASGSQRQAVAFEDERVLFVRRSMDQQEAFVVYNFGDDPVDIAIPVPAGTYRLLLNSTDSKFSANSNSTTPREVVSTGQMRMSFGPSESVVYTRVR
jgi:hypothetical protein